MARKITYLPEKTDLFNFIKEIKSLDNIEFSDSLVERISVSGDVTGSPFFHWRWKKKYLADYVAWPKNEMQLSSILKVANKRHVPITPRGAGSCYFGSGVPAYGGIVIDLKQMTSFKVDIQNKLVIAQPGVCFSILIEALSAEGYQLGCYPTSALTATVGGWIGTGGLVGIGTFQNGPFIDQIIHLRVVLATGDVKVFTKREEFEPFFGGCGIYGVISEVAIKIYPISTKIPLFFGFNNLTDMINSTKELLSLNNLFAIRFSDYQHEIRLGEKSQFQCYIFLLISGLVQEIQKQRENALKIVNTFSGVYLGDDSSQRIFNGLLKQEMRLKTNVPVLMLQAFCLELSNCKEILDLFEQLTEKRMLNHCYSGLINKDGKVRLLLFTPTDSDYITHFLASKGITHRIVKKIYHDHKGQIYTYGLYNTLYLKKFDPEKYTQLREKKQNFDPNFILNPLKVIKTKARFKRINTIFEMNLFWRTLFVKLGFAKEILMVRSSFKEKKVVLNKARR